MLIEGQLVSPEGVSRSRVKWDGETITALGGRQRITGSCFRR